MCGGGGGAGLPQHSSVQPLPWQGPGGTVSLDGTLSQRAITDANSSLGSCQSLNEHQLASVQIYRIVRGRCLVQLMGATRTALVEGTTTQLKQISAKQASHRQYSVGACQHVEREREVM